MTEETTLVRFEPCCGFRPETPGAAVCAECGWLADDHPPAVGAPVAAGRAARHGRRAS
ncbi:MAG: hypothetical protein KatS3mg009_2716 [Acidimicrobiia bacterium]|nr:MAG: hypothetical protein KatS3mg009_2716 [Acidimicrobiia bacterium]